MIFGQAAGSLNYFHQIVRVCCVVRRRCVATRRSRCWFYVVVYECRITVRSVWGTEVEARRLRDIPVVVNGVLEC